MPRLLKKKDQALKKEGTGYKKKGWGSSQKWTLWAPEVLKKNTFAIPETSRVV